MSRDIPQPGPKTYGKLRTESPFSPYSAFVVQLRRETDVACGCLNGRVEHEGSGQATISPREKSYWPSSGACWPP